MKCPKCGYNSFEYLDSCKKCSNDLAGFKTAHGIRAFVLPSKQFVAEAPAEDPMVEAMPDMVATTMPESSEFSWQDSPEPTPAAADDFPSLEFDLPQQEPDSFSFNLDMDSQEEGTAAPEDAFKELSLEDLGGGELPASEITPDMPTEAVSLDKPLSQLEDPSFGELCFGEPENEGEGKEIAETESAIEPIPDFFASTGLDAAPDPVSDEAFDSLLEAGPDQGGDATPFDFGQEQAADLPADLPPDPFKSDDQPPAQQPGDTGDDLLGLSPEEYESLFGETPLKKKTAVQQ